MLATSSLHDTRVYVTEPAKWVARLRETVTSDLEQRPVLLRTEMAAGHGGRSGRYAAWEQIAWEWAFVLDQLGATERIDPGSLTAALRTAAGQRVKRMGLWLRPMSRSAVEPTCSPGNPPEPRLPTTTVAAPSVRSTRARTGSARTTS